MVAEEVFAKIGDNGLFGVTVPQEYGGAGLDLLAAGLVLQGFGRWNHAMALAWVAHDNLCLKNIYRNGDERQRRKYLPGLCSGRKIGALGLTEPGLDRTRWGRCARARAATGPLHPERRQDLHHQRARGRRAARLRQNRTGKGGHGISAFIIEKDFPGFKVAQRLEKTGHRGESNRRACFRDRRVPVKNLLGAGRIAASPSSSAV